MVPYFNSPSPNNWPIPHLCAQKYAPYCDSQSLFQLKYKKLLEMVYFFPPHTILGVGKNHDLKKWVTLGDAQGFTWGSSWCRALNV